MKFLYIWIIGSQEEELYKYFPILTYVKWNAPLWGHFWAEFIFMCKLYKPCPKDAVPQISEYLECQFMRRRFYKIDQILPLFAPYWAPVGASPLIFTNLNPHFPKMLPTKFGWNWFSGFGEEVI